MLLRLAALALPRGPPLAGFAAILAAALRAGGGGGAGRAEAVFRFAAGPGLFAAGFCAGAAGFPAGLAEARDVVAAALGFAGEGLRAAEPLAFAALLAGLTGFGAAALTVALARAPPDLAAGALFRADAGAAGGVFGAFPGFFPVWRVVPGIANLRSRNSFRNRRRRSHWDF